jgi:hypothetical protein
MLGTSGAFPFFMSCRMASKIAGALVIVGVESAHVGSAQGAPGCAILPLRVVSESDDAQGTA